MRKKTRRKILFAALILLVFFGQAQIKEFWNQQKTDFTTAVNEKPKLKDISIDIGDTVVHFLDWCSGVSDHLSEKVAPVVKKIADPDNNTSGNTEVDLPGRTEETSAVADNLIEVTLDAVVDGDTIWVRKGDERIKVRLIGINTEESVHADSEKNNEFGYEASDYTKELLKDTDRLYLEYDEEEKDQYDRNLCYVWFTQDTSDYSNMLNAKLIQDGYAYAYTFEPNIKYKELFADLEETAMNDKVGLYANEEFAAIAKKKK